MADNATDSLYNRFDKKNMSELLEISKSKTATPEEIAMAERLLRERSEKERQREEMNKEDTEYIKRKEGAYTLAYGGKLHRGRTAGLSAEKAR